MAMMEISAMAPSETMHTVGATDYVLSKSSVCRHYRKYARELVLFSVDFLAQLPVETVDQSGPHLTKHLRGRIKGKKLGNPILIFILMYIVIPIIVQLVLEWWKNR